jgi:hypothetical protein
MVAIFNLPDGPGLRDAAVAAARNPAVVAPIPATMSPGLKTLRNATVAPVRAPSALNAQTAAVMAPDMSPIAYAQRSYRETSNPFDAALQGWVNAGMQREAAATDEEKKQQVAEALNAHPDLASFVVSGTMEPADAIRIAGERDVTTKKTAVDQKRKDQISAYLTELSGSDERYAKIAKQWAAGVLDEDGVSAAIAKLDEPVKAPTPTDDMKELEVINAERKASGKEPMTMESFLAAKKPGVSIDMGGGANDKFWSGGATARGQNYAAMEQAGNDARSRGNMIGQLESYLASAPQGAEGTFKAALGTFGIATEGLDDIQAAQALISKMVPSQRIPGSGTMSDRDLELFKQSIPSIMNQPGGNAQIIKVLKGIADYEQTIGSIAARALDGEITPAESRIEMQAVPNPLASVSEASATPADAPAAEAPPAPTTQEEYDQLPAGTQYLAPDGTVRTKP